MTRRSYSLGIPVLILILLFPTTASSPGVLPLSPNPSPDRAQVRAALHSAPLMFIENVGQHDPAARFQVRGATGAETLWLAQEGLWLTLVARPQHDASAPLAAMPYHTGADEDRPRQGVNLRLSFVGANPNPRLQPFDRLKTHVSYLIGNDRSRWHTDVPVWTGVRYLDLYPGVDLELSGKDGHLEARLLAQPGAYLGRVRLQVEGAEAVGVDVDQLRLITSVGQVNFPLLNVSSSISISTPVVDGEVISTPFAHSMFPNSLDRPVDDLLYSTFLGGSDVGMDGGLALAVDGEGAIYVTGWTETLDFPTTPGAFDPDTDGADAFVTKLNAAGSELVYSTFLGGYGSEIGHGIAVDAAGAAYITGHTGSFDFPTTPGAFDRSFNYFYDTFVTKLNAAGSELIYSTYLGGSSHDEGRALAVDGLGAAYITGYTKSTDFPTTAGAFDPTYNGEDNVFVSKLNAAGSGLVYSTYLGGSSPEWGIGIAVDGAGAAYVTGMTFSHDFPITQGAFDTSYNGGLLSEADAFVTKLNAAGSGLVYSTFLGGSYFDRGMGIAVDASGAAYVAGYTESADFPTTPGAFDRTCGCDPTYPYHISDIFVVKLVAMGSALDYATFLGGSSHDIGTSLAVDGAGAAYLTGFIESADFPTTAGAFDTTYNGDVDAFVTKLNAAGSGLVYSTFLGGNSHDYGYALALDEAGKAYVAGITDSPNFPITPGAYDTTCGCDPVNYYGDVFATKLGMEGVTPVQYRLSLSLILK